MPHDAPPPRIDDYRGSFVQGRVANALTQVKTCLAYLHDVQEMSLPAALHGLAAAKQLGRYVNALDETFDIAALAEMESTGVTSFTGPGFTATLRGESSRKNWQDESIVNELADRFVATASSEYPDIPERDLRALTLKAMDQVVSAGRTEWRSRALKALGVDPDEFSTKTPRPGRSLELTGEATYAHMKDFGSDTNGR